MARSVVVGRPNTSVRFLGLLKIFSYLEMRTDQILKFMKTENFGFGLFNSGIGHDRINRLELSLVYKGSERQ